MEDGVTSIILGVQTQEALEALRSIREATQKDINKMRQDRS